MPQRVNFIDFYSGLTLRRHRSYYPLEKNCSWVLFFTLALAYFLCPLRETQADSLASNPIVFVTMVPNPADFGTLAATFGNHVANPNTAFRGGDLWIRYPDGTLKNLTSVAGYGTSGQQGASAIAVRDPAAHWDGTKVIFSMVVGAPTQQYQLGTYRWQLYEITGLGPSDTPVITKVANQPSSYNNHSPVYASDDSIIFVSDRPRDDTVLHTYPQRDEYESSPVNSGLWKINASTGALTLLDHAPSGDFNPIIDSFGRVIFTRWDHLQRDQQNVGVDFGAFNYESEVSTVATSSAAEVFPEPRSVLDPDYQSHINLHTINQFFPWMMHQDGTGLETLNHIGRQEIGLYSERSFNNDSNVQEFYGQYATGANQNEFTIFLHIKENPLNAGTYLGTSCQEFGTHSGGQIISLTGAPGVNPDDMEVTYLTHPDTAGATNSPGPNHSGLYRDPLPLSNGNLLAVHTSNTRQDSNIGSSSSPLSRYDYRIKLLTQSGQYYSASTPLTSGISKTVSFWNPDSLISYSGTLWEMMPIELVARTRPSAGTQELPSIESAVLTSAGVQTSELTQYLRDNNLALVISRNLTTRDRNDRQQPTNLRVNGGTAESIPNSGTVYDIQWLQFFQGDLIRGYSNGNNSGRRVLAQPMHSVPSNANPSAGNSAPTGAVRIASDGSMAAFVPAGRALTWHMSAEDNTPIVRERYWVTFQAGEIRVCSSCHGVNTADQLGASETQNSPLALASLLAHWKGLPSENSPSSYTFLVLAPKKKPAAAFTIRANGGANDDALSLKLRLNGKQCAGKRNFTSTSTTRRLKGKFLGTPGLKYQFQLWLAGEEQAEATKQIKVSGTAKKLSTKEFKNSCKKLLKDLKATSN